MPVHFRSMFLRTFVWLLAPLALAGSARVGAAQYATQYATQYPEMTWPQQIESDSTTIVIDQPQPMTLKGLTLTARAAFSVATGKAEPVFGVMWMTARAQTDRDSRTMDIDQVVLTDVRFPDMTDADEKRLEAIIIPKIQAAHFGIPLDGLETALAAAAAERGQPTASIRHPPRSCSQRCRQSPALRRQAGCSGAAELLAQVCGEYADDGGPGP